MTATLTALEYGQIMLITAILVIVVWFIVKLTPD